MIEAPKSDSTTLEAPDGLPVSEIASALRMRLKALAAAGLVSGALAFGATFLVSPHYLSRTTFLPPQSQQNNAFAALASLSALTGAGTTLKTPGDQYVALLQSVNVADRLIDKFGLMQVYDEQLRIKTREQLFENSRIWLGKRDGIITVEVEDTNPERAAAIANQYVDELRRLISELALTEAQQRRAFFERQMNSARAALERSQRSLERSGIGAGVLRAEPKAAMEGYARLLAEITAAEVRLEALRRGYTENAVEVQKQVTTLAALRQQLRSMEVSDQAANGSEYLGKLREFKYQEALLELFARQYEAAKLDESRDSGLVQVIDVATAAERKNRPRRLLVALGTAGVVLVFGALIVVLARRKPGSPGRT